ncbi:hypothetical protein OCV51_07575 [Faecalicatena acetigenes]|uniref:Uncharacterized protein n=2 Tax=Lachnospiraceae TaxID=186803 RepID=A0ABT2TB83_9FIRM|nr:hypothetical protein [Faecalicatena acetigenes]MCU6747515.1 hypothetical protein [Faecalicatena acetigenes]SCH93343.1 Uncharacterised protein [uncultured Clostridium sp.]
MDSNLISRIKKYSPVAKEKKIHVQHYGVEEYLKKLGLKEKCESGKSRVFK